ncbi:unannotated protein [freshwater metagenome]|uniref:Unannotated protein n=1 Tax=freshwater metagenome TaxID=449393 RepID=A0A6J7IAL7_9ZZZZ|nr:hypothetical protein [Actinomycetota bacterium]
MRTDPTDNGGLFVGRRPGTGPLRLREDPGERDPRSLRRDALFAYVLLALMVVVNLLFWGPIPLGWLWIVAHIGFLAERTFLAVIVAFAAILMTLVVALSVLKRLDHAWILVRRAAGIDQRQGAIGRIFAYTALVGVSLFGLWMILGGGLADSLNPSSP